MASLSKRQDSKFWYVSFRVPVEFDPQSGAVQKWKQYQRCTRTTNRSEAEKIGYDLEKAAKAEAGAGDETSRRLLGVLRKATEVASRGVLNEPTARAFMAEIYEAATGQKLQGYSVESWLNAWIQRKESKVKHYTLRVYKRVVAGFLKWLGDDRRQERLELITATDIEDFCTQIHNNGRAASTANQYKRVLFAAFKAAARTGILLKNPADGVEDIPEDDSTKRLPFTLDEVRQLVKAADPEWRVAICLSAFAGLRLTDASDIRWSSINLEKGTLSYEPKKQRRSLATKKIITVAIHESLREVLDAIPVNDDPDAPVLPSLTGRDPGGTYGLSTEFTNLMNKVGIDRGVVRSKETGAVQEVAERSFHSLRHTCNQLLLEAGVDIERRRQILGHESDQINARYSKWRAELIAEDIGRMAKL